MAPAIQGRLNDVSAPEFVSNREKSSALLDLVKGWLDEAKATDLVAIDLRDKSVISDYMVIASGNNERHVGAIADQLQKHLKAEGLGRARVEGQDSCDWVLIDIGDIVVHVFRPEVREFYNLERMWSGDRPHDATH